MDISNGMGKRRQRAQASVSLGCLGRTVVKSECKRGTRDRPRGTRRGEFGTGLEFLQLGYVGGREPVPSSRSRTPRSCPC